MKTGWGTVPKVGKQLRALGRTMDELCKRYEEIGKARNTNCVELRLRVHRWLDVEEDWADGARVVRV